MDKFLEAIAENIVCFGVLGFLTITSVAYYIAQAAVWIVEAKNKKGSNQDENID